MVPLDGYYYCTRTNPTNPNDKVTGVGKDKNGNNKVDEWGADGKPGTDDDEVWCVQGEDNLTGPPIPCPPWIKPRTVAQADCVENGGNWSQSDSVYQCTSSGWDRVFFWEDLNGDDGIQIDEYWCEYKDANGNPDGVKKPCLENADWE